MCQPITELASVMCFKLAKIDVEGRGKRRGSRAGERERAEKEEKLSGNRGRKSSIRFVKGIIYKIHHIFY